MYKRLSRAFVSTHSRPKAAGICPSFGMDRRMFQHTAARRRLVSPGNAHAPVIFVSTHSRPKAAGPTVPHRRELEHRFNTQPPEGGWKAFDVDMSDFSGFNTQPPEGGWLQCSLTIWTNYQFQHTAARRRLVRGDAAPLGADFSFNTQPPEGGWP